MALGIWLTPIPSGLTVEAWHLFAIFAAAILSVILNAFPLLTASMLAVAAAVLTRAVDPTKAFAGFANASVLLVVVAFLVAYGVVKSGLGARLSLMVVSVFGRSTLGLGYSIFLTDALIAPAFPSNTARGGVLFPIVLALAQNAGSKPEDPGTRRLGGYLMFCGMASLAVSSALWLTATSVNPIGQSLAKNYGLEIGFGSWFVAASVPALTAILLLPLVLYLALSTRRDLLARRARGRPREAALVGTTHPRRADRGGRVRAHGDRLGHGRHPEPEPHRSGLWRPGGAPHDRRPHRR